MPFQNIASHQAKRHYLIIPMAYAAFIYYLSSLPGTPASDKHTGWALLEPILFNFLHIPLYAILAWLWRWSLDAWHPQIRHPVIITLVLTITYAVFDEWHQSFTPHRYPSISDIALDIVAIGSANWLYSTVKFDHTMQHK